MSNQLQKIAIWAAWAGCLGAPSLGITADEAPKVHPMQARGKSVAQVIAAPETGISARRRQPTEGELRVVTEGREVDALPLEHTRVAARVDGDQSEVTVTQRFQNPYDDTIEAIYIFPLPTHAAVNDMRMTLGDRVIRGEIRRKEEARQIYETAKRAGHVAALLDQERPNIFTQSVANILPGNAIEVSITYVQALPLENGRYAFVFPMVVGPRFIPGAPPTTPENMIAGKPGAPERRPAPPAGTGTVPDTDQVPDASRITPPVLPPDTRSGHTIEVELEIAAGTALRDLESPSHAIDVERPAPNTARVRLHPADTIPNKDLVVHYGLSGEAPELAVRTYRDDAGVGYFHALMVPPAAPDPADIRPKELIFVVDCSGSMRGEPMAKAKEAMRHALKHLDPRDSFQIVRFSEMASGLSAAPLPATPKNVRDGLRYVEQLAGSGGTMMIEGVRAALGYAPDPERLRIVAFMTDGYIGNETQILGEIRARLGDARLFSFGVGNSVNRYLLDGMAREGRGAVEYVLLSADTRKVVERFYARIGQPLLTDVSVDWGALSVTDVSPDPVPDLFAGQTIALSGRYDTPATGEVVVRGLLGGRAWEGRYQVTLPETTSGSPAIGAVWARRQIAALERQTYRSTTDASVEEAITQLALDHRLMSRFTSFVAVEDRIEVVGGERRTVTVPVELPEGVDYEGVFGDGGPALHSSMGMGNRALGSMHFRGGRGAAVRAQVPLEDVESVIDLKPGVMKASGDAGAEESDAAKKAAPPEAELIAREAGPLTLTAQLQASRASLKVGDTLELLIHVTNRGTQAVSWPAQLRLGAAGLELSIIDNRWRSITVDPSLVMSLLGGGKPGAALEPGQSVDLRLSIPVGPDAGVEAPVKQLPGPGTYHIAVRRLQGSRVESNRLQLEVRE